MTRPDRWTSTDIAMNTQRPDNILRETVTHYEPDDRFEPLMSQDELDEPDWLHGEPAPGHWRFLPLAIVSCVAIWGFAGWAVWRAWTGVAW